MGLCNWERMRAGTVMSQGASSESNPLRRSRSPARLDRPEQLQTRLLTEGCVQNKRVGGLLLSRWVLEGPFVGQTSSRQSNSRPWPRATASALSPCPRRSGATHGRTCSCGCVTSSGRPRTNTVVSRLEAGLEVEPGRERSAAASVCSWISASVPPSIKAELQIALNGDEYILK